ncbi:hypothetical protein Gxy13693_071_018 [Komagataeibacter xylinus NBRC 13693]|uniref:Uncharacterized protein n=1 Tax=Komagataeibacter xylinus NBRC 13693 TaxID=1234668 RepID=A0A0D6QD69_KOMXY|nr:hypothetical protein Gxy13693_071_018 [Komagataeibacter xylinus NBRC 13693]
MIAQNKDYAFHIERLACDASAAKPDFRAGKKGDVHQSGFASARSISGRGAQFRVRGPPQPPRVSNRQLLYPDSQPAGAENDDEQQAR